MRIAILSFVLVLIRSASDSADLCKSEIRYCTQCKNKKACAQCEPGFILKSGDCVCDTGLYLDQASGACQKCSNKMPGCLSCSDEQRCTSCDRDRGFLFNRKQQRCDCNVGDVYNENTGSCADCSSVIEGCSTCQTSKNCKVCSDGYYLQGTICKPCNSGCKTCNGGSSNHCLSCQEPDLELDVTSCVCAPGDDSDTSSRQKYGSREGRNTRRGIKANNGRGKGRGKYKNDQNKCIKCYSTCSDCSGSQPNQCTGCIEGLVLLKNLNGGNEGCGCPNIDEYLNGTSCLKCSQFCQTCSGGEENECLSCANNMMLKEGNCICASGQYLSAPSECQMCDANCGTCAGSSTTCTSCNNGLTLSGSQCICASGQYLSAPSECQMCDANCGTCAGSSTTCTSCNNGLTLSGSQCICASGQYLSAPSECQMCDANCGTCAGSSTTCTSCNNGLTLSGSQCICASGQYLSAPSECQMCDANCGTCAGSSTTCTSCNNGLTLSGSQCICASGQYLSAPSECQMCDANCGTCAGSSTTCTSCNNGLTLSGSQCICASGQYLSAPSECQMCDANCGTCAGSSTTCTSCNNGLTLSGSQCICASGQYLSAPSECQMCDANCGTCAGSSTTCTSCNNGLTLSGSQCICASGQYLSAPSECQMCDANCGTCAGSSTTCTSCNNGLTLSGSQCICASGQYLSAPSECQMCDANCGTCAGSSTTCTSCNNGLTLSGSQCICASGQYLSAPSECQMCDANCGTCAGSSTTCTSCNNGLTLSGSQCICASGQYLSAPSECQMCDANCGTCAGSSTTCTSCNNGLTLSGSQCICASGQYLSAPSECQMCDANCGTCAGSSTTCTSCNNGLTLSGSQCICTNSSLCPCSLGSYASNQNTSCLQCNPLCTSCTSSSLCTSCVSTASLSDSLCTCPSSTFQLANSCLICSSSCLSCSGPSSSECLTCNTTSSYLNGSSCVCQPFYTQNDANICEYQGCPFGFYENVDQCTEICGDGILFTLACDDGNTISGDGCSSTCQVEQNYTCTSGNSTNASSCYYSKPIIVQILSTTKDLSSNTLYFSVQLVPGLAALSSLNFSSIFTSNLSSLMMAFNYKDNGTLAITAAYNESVQFAPASFTFSPASPSNSRRLLASTPVFSQTPSTTIEFSINPQNNVAANFYEPAVYSAVRISNIMVTVLMYLTFATLLLSFFTSKFIGVQTLGVIQIAFIGLLIVNYVQPVLAPLTQLIFINGPNDLFKGVKTDQLPDRISSLQYQSEFAVSLNYGLAILCIPLVAALILFIASKAIKKHDIKLQKYSWIALCGFGFTAAMFILYHFVITTLLFSIYNKMQLYLFPVSLTVCIVTFAVLISIFVLFKYRPMHFGEFRTAFKISSRFCRNYYYFIIAGRIALCCILVGLNNFDFVGFICLLVPVTNIVALAVKRPYKHMYNNVRAIFNQCVVCAVFALYSAYRFSVSPTDTSIVYTTILPCVEIALLYLSVIFNTASMIKFKVDEVKEEKIREEEATKVHFVTTKLNEIDDISEIPKDRLSHLEHLPPMFARQQSVRCLKKMEDFEPENPVDAQKQSEQAQAIIMKGAKQQIKQKLVTKKVKSVNFETAVTVENQTARGLNRSGNEPDDDHSI